METLRQLIEAMKAKLLTYTFMDKPLTEGQVDLIIANFSLQEEFTQEMGMQVDEGFELEEKMVNLANPDLSWNLAITPEKVEEEYDKTVTDLEALFNLAFQEVFQENAVNPVVYIGPK